MVDVQGTLEKKEPFDRTIKGLYPTHQRERSRHGCRSEQDSRSRWLRGCVQTSLGIVDDQPGGLPLAAQLRTFLRLWRALGHRVPLQRLASATRFKDGQGDKEHIRLQCT